MISNFVGFIFFVISFLYLPTRLLLNVTQKNDDELLNIGISLITGLVGLTLISFLLRLGGLSFQLLWFIPALSFLIVLKKKNIGIPNLKNHYSVLLIIVLGILTQMVVLFRGGMTSDVGYLFPSIHDTFWNIAISNELSTRIPPFHPGLAGEILKNNHYFYPLFLTTIRQLLGIDILDLYFRFGPLLVSLIFGLSLYAFSTIFTQNRTTQALAVFLGYFSGNFSFLLPIFKGFSYSWAGNNFVSDQPFDQIINPYSILGFSIFLFSLYCFYKNWLVLAGLLSGSLYGFKSFGGIILIISIAITSLIIFILARDKKIILLSFFSLLVFIPVFFNFTDIRTSSLKFAPFWILTEMMVGKDKLDLPYFGQIENYYQSIGNTAGLVKIRATELAIYILGNLGTRILGLIALVWFLIANRAQKALLFTGIFSLASVFISFTIPLFFNLGANAHNIVQFTPYSLVILAVLTAIFLESLYRHFKIPFYSTIGLTGILLLIVLSIPVNIKNINGKLSPPNGFISYEEKNALEFLRSKTSRDDIILINPYQFNTEYRHEDPIYIPALSQRKIYLSSPGFVTQVGFDPTKKLEKIENFFKKGNINGFLQKEKIAYIYILKPFTIFNIKNYTTKIYENDKVIIYKVN